jgi:hypothetical protein
MGNPLWLTGVDAPITKKHISKYLKISKKYLDIHLDSFCSFMKFREKRTFFVASVKNKFRCSNIVIYVTILSFLHMSYKMSFHRKTLWVNINCSDLHSEFFI